MNQAILVLNLSRSEVASDKIKHVLSLALQIIVCTALVLDKVNGGRVGYDI